MIDRSAPKPVAPSFITMSHDEPLLQSLVVIAHGQMGAGKTTLAASASEHFPDELPTVRHAGPPKYILEDMAWMSFDAKATAGFRERGISVPNFDVENFMQNEEVYKAAGYKTAPTVFQAATFGLNALKARKPQWLVIDTVSAFDLLLKNYYKKYTDSQVADGKLSAKRAGFVLYDSMLEKHTDFYVQCKRVAPSVLFLCHSKAEIDLDDADQKKRAGVLQTATGGMITPAITGQAKRVYKGPASLQLAIMTKTALVGGKRALERYVSPIKTGDHETKNRFEVSLSDKEPAHLGKILAKIRE